MEASSIRRIRSGAEYEHLFPIPQGIDITIKEDAGVSDTVSLIQRTVPKTLDDTRKIAKTLKGSNLENTCRNIWDFVYEHIRYKKDEDGIEQVRRPSRTWQDRKHGVDCDCYSTFISSILTNLGIPHKLRIAIYQWNRGYQHIYPVVPVDGRINYTLKDRENYIVIDCVKDAFDDEHPLIDFKDYNMKLDYLNGIENEREYIVPNSTDAQDFAELYDDYEEIGELGNWLTSAVSSVSKAVKSTVNTVKDAATKTVEAVKKAADKTGDVLADGVHIVNRYANPATILLRNGFLLSMKLNVMYVAQKLRYAYLSDEQARKMNFNMNSLNDLRSIKDKAETIYWQAGGLKENLKAAILEGDGNKDKKVPLNGLAGLGRVYADMDEYEIMHMDVSGLGEVATATAISAAAAAVGAVAAALTQIKGIFNTAEEIKNDVTNLVTSGANAVSNAVNNTVNTAASAVSNAGSNAVNTLVSSANNMISSAVPGGINLSPSNFSLNPGSVSASVVSANGGKAPAYTVAIPINNASSTSVAHSVGLPAIPNQSPGSGNYYPAPQGLNPNQYPAMPGNSQTEAQGEGIMEKATSWIKENPVPTMVIASVAAGGGYMLYKSNQKKPSGRGLSGVPKSGKKKKRKSTKTAKRIQLVKI